MKKLVVLFFCGLLCLAGCTKDEEPLASGTTGELTWKLLGNGTLIIRGKGEMPDYWYNYFSPWYEHRNEITGVKISNNVNTISNYAFVQCSSLMSITIPNSVTSIGAQAFYGCNSLTSVTIPNSITSIGSRAFADCSSLTSITIPNSVMSIESYTFSDCSSLTSVIIPNSVITIEYAAFHECTSLTSITIGSSVRYISDFVFYGCSGLTEIINERTVPQMIGLGVFVNMNKSVCTLRVPEASIEEYRNANVWKDFGNIVAIK